MMRVALLFTLSLSLVLASPAWADEPGEVENQPAKALAIQALSILEQGLAEEEAAEKLEHALEANDQADVKPDVLAAALEALETGDHEEAEALLQRAFTDEEIHVVGVTLRPNIETARVAAGIVGGIIIALATLGLLQRRRTERRYPAART